MGALSTFTSHVQLKLKLRLAQHCGITHSHTHMQTYTHTYMHALIHMYRVHSYLIYKELNLFLGFSYELIQFCGCFSHAVTTFIHHQRTPLLPYSQDIYNCIRKYCINVKTLEVQRRTSGRSFLLFGAELESIRQPVSCLCLHCEQLT